MAVSTTKKVVVKRFDRGSVAGYVNPGSCFADRGVEVLTPGGSVLVIPYNDIKLVGFVRDFPNGQEPEERKTFTHRPKASGLWVRMQFLDGDLWDGVLVNDLLQWEAHGFSVVPPDPASNQQRLFVPRTALKWMHVVAVIGGRAQARRKTEVSQDQIRLFEE